MRFERGEMNAHRRGTDRRCVCSTGGQLVAAHAPAFPVAVQCCSSFKLRRFKTVAPRGLSSGLHLGAARAAQTVRRIPDCVELGPGRPQHWGRPGPSEAQLGLFYPSSRQNWDTCTPTGIVPPSVGGGSGPSWGRIGPNWGRRSPQLGWRRPGRAASWDDLAPLRTHFVPHAGAPQLGEPPQLG